MAHVMSIQQPNTLAKAQEDERWMEAMKVEYNSKVKNRTWDLVDCPSKRKVTSTKWVYKAKYKSNGSLEKYKAKLVPKGYT